MEARWRAAGNEATLAIVPDAVHGFLAFEIEATRRSRVQQYAFVGG